MKMDQASIIRACYFCCLKGISKSAQVLFDGIEAVVILTSIILRYSEP